MGQATSAEQPPSGISSSSYNFCSPPRKVTPDPPRKRHRISFGSGFTNNVRGWPSTGGYLTLACDGVMLDYLGLSRFEEVPPSENAVEEDAHCAKMRRLGAIWWASKEEQIDYFLGNTEVDESLNDIRIFGCPPSRDGVWVLHLRSDQAATQRVGRIYNTRTMDERCYWIEKLGGTYYPDPENCPHLHLDGIMQGRSARAPSVKQ